MDGVVFLNVDSASDIDKDQFSGIIGLSPMSDLSRIPAFVEQIGKLGGVGGSAEVKPIFSIFLSNSPDRKGRITFGGYDLASFAKTGMKESDVIWTSLAHQTDHFWNINMGQISIGDG
jgi:hypothetical protein